MIYNYNLDWNRSQTRTSCTAVTTLLDGLIVATTGHIAGQQQVLTIGID